MGVSPWAAIGALDDAALEALASKGLLRRAQKDLEGGLAVKVVAETDEGLTIQVAEYSVTIPEAGPAKARCGCPARGTCQHILAACLFIRRSAGQQQLLDLSSGAQAASSVQEELLALTVEQLTKWAGKSAMRGAATLLGSQPEVAIEERGAAVVAFPDLNIECRYVPGGGLDGMIVSAPPNQVAKFAVAAVLAYQGARGHKPPLPVAITPSLAEAAGAPRSRAEVLESTRSLVEEVVAVGLSHLSPSYQQRAATLAVSALGVNLPRLALSWRGIGDEVGLLQRREAQADEGRLLSILARTAALTRALAQGGESPRVDLVGWHRTRYEDVGHLDLCGVGGYQWRTASGYRGLTVLFWEKHRRRLYSWSEARPEHLSGGFKPADRYRQEGPWQGATSPDLLSRSQFKLMQARVNAVGRLSASGRSRVVVTGPTEPEALDFGPRGFGRWASARLHAAACIPVGLDEFRPLEEFVVLRVAKWARRAFDSITQVFSWDLEDETGDVLSIELRYTEENKHAITQLEAFNPDKVGAEGVLGRLIRNPRGWSFLPVSLLQRAGATQPILNLGLDSVGTDLSASGAASVRPETGVLDSTGEEESLDEEHTDDRAETDTVHVQRLTDVQNALISLAEHGTRSSNPATRGGLPPLVGDLDNMGLQALARSLERLRDAPDAERASALLRASYVAELHLQAGSRYELGESRGFESTS